MQQGILIRLKLFCIKITNLFYQKIKYDKEYLFNIDNQLFFKYQKDLKKNKINLRNDSRNLFPLEVKFDKIVFDNSIGLTDPINPLVLTCNQLLDEKEIAYNKTEIFNFCQNFQPKNFAENFFLSHNCNELNKLSQYTLFYPWFHKFPQRFLVPGMFGPKKKFYKFRIYRLRELILSLKKYGYRPSEEDAISGYKLIYNDDFRFVYTAGQHRISAFYSVFREKTKFHKGR